MIGRMQALKMLTAVMGVMIVAGLAVIAYTIAHRLGGPAAGVPNGALTDAVLAEPEGTAIAGVGSAGDRIAVSLHGGGPDRVVLLDARTLAVVGHIKLAR